MNNQISKAENNDSARSSKLYNQARVLMTEKKLDEAAEMFQQSISLAPHFKSLELLGECFILLNRIKEAVVPLAAAVTLNRGVRAAALLAEVFLKLEDYGKAKDLAETALRRDANNKTALNVMKIVSEK
jgi:tetratricopeptide (TPR) repeat protein